MFLGSRTLKDRHEVFPIHENIRKGIISFQHFGGHFSFPKTNSRKSQNGTPSMMLSPPQQYRHLGNKHANYGICSLIPHSRNIKVWLRVGYSAQCYYLTQDGMNPHWELRTENQDGLFAFPARKKKIVLRDDKITFNWTSCTNISLAAFKERHFDIFRNTWQSVTVDRAKSRPHTHWR